ncbi:hypothetical protein [Lentzea sp. CC55]|uniref:hypothetical protein n=1 Tax=Lentzea sp. CC55 TaxID=2884909 RepID=UPI001F43D204|nr:hypothetical protein [Lentzea sp. CC55]MCG8926093.1 hypothetical protein [Lentzea sp. CC55]
MNGGVHFHGNVTAGTMNNAAQGDINNNYGRQHFSSGLDARQVSQLVRALRAELDSAPLTDRARNAAHDALDEVDRGVVEGGERRGVADKVLAVKEVLGNAGGAVAAGGALWTAMRALAAAVGLSL